MFGSDDTYCSDCECESCEAIRKQYQKPYVYTPVPPGHYQKSFIINEEKEIKMSEEMNIESIDGKPLEGQSAKASREARESIAKMLGNISDHHQVIVIAKDLTGATPTHVHAQGPVNDSCLLYGMLEQARDVFQLSNKPKQ